MPLGWKKNALQLNMTLGTPSIKRKVGVLPNVGNRAKRPFVPFERATLLSEPLGLSYERQICGMRGCCSLGVLRIPRYLLTFSPFLRQGKSMSNMRKEECGESQK